MHRFAVVDLETTGFGKTDRILEIGIVLVDGHEITQEWETLLNPQRDISNSHIHGITAELVSLAPTFEEVVDEISHFLHGRIFVAHNISFDSRMLCAEFARLKRQVDLGDGFCTLQATGQKLANACLMHGINNECAHRALTDARSTAHLLTKVFSAERTVHPIAIETFSPTRSLRTISRAAMQSGQSPGYTSLRRIVRNVAIDGWDGPLLSYLDALCSVLSDMRLTTEERRHLKEWATELGLSDQQQAHAHKAFVNSVIAAANRDSFVSESERELIARISQELNVRVEIPVAAETSKPATLLSPGMKICFTGEARDASGEVITREKLEAQASAAGYVPVDSVTKKGCNLLVAVDVSSMSGKTRKARDYGIPVISVSDFLVLMKK